MRFRIVKSHPFSITAGERDTLVEEYEIISIDRGTLEDLLDDVRTGDHRPARAIVDELLADA